MYTINILCNPRILKAILSRFDSSYLDVFDFRQCCEQKDFTFRFVISHLCQRKVPFTLSESEKWKQFCVEITFVGIFKRNLLLSGLVINKINYICIPLNRWLDIKDSFPLSDCNIINSTVFLILLKNGGGGGVDYPFRQRCRIYLCRRNRSVKDNCFRWY